MAIRIIVTAVLFGTAIFLVYLRKYLKKRGL
jgi:hypothetical protein